MKTNWNKPITQEQSRMQTWLLPAENAGWYSALPSLEFVAAGFAPIGLKQMDAVALLNRIDTKYVMTRDQLIIALAAIQPYYRILSVDGQRLNHYRTLYFDTPDFQLYNAHTRGQAERYKVRSREYTDSALAFLEVKHKTRKGRTIKERMMTDEPVMEMTDATENWLKQILPEGSEELQPKIWNTFTRLTLVNRQDCERVTLDVDLSFQSGDQTWAMDGLAIAEVKMDAGNQSSPFLAQMRSQRVRPRGFSKYIVGVSQLYDTVKKNTMKPKLLWIEKMMKGAHVS